MASIRGKAFLHDWPSQCLDMTKQVSKDQSPAAKRKAWSALSHIFSRLEGMVEVAGLKKDSSAAAAKLAPALLQTLRNVDDSNAWEAALRALSAILLAVPSSLRHHEAALTSATVDLLMAPSPAMHAARRQAALCLALLPQVAGTSEAWAARLQELLATLHALLDVVMLGLEDRKLVTACRATVDPAVQPLAAAASTTSGGIRSLVPPLRQAGGLLDCLVHLMTRATTAPAPLPPASLLGLATRVLAVDTETASDCGQQATSASLQGDLAAALPGLHTIALSLIAITLHCGGEGAIAHHGAVVRMLASQLRQLTVGDVAPHWTVRCAVYESAAEVIQIVGFAATLDMAQPAVDAAQQELLEALNGPSDAASWSATQMEGVSLPGDHPAKRRRIFGGGNVQTEHAGNGVSVNGTKHSPSTSGSEEGGPGLAAHTAALHLLGAVLQGGVARLSLPLRAQVDALVLHFAQGTSAAAASASCQGGASAAIPTATLLPALQTLLLAATAGGAYRFPYLPQALKLFQSHARSPNAQLSAFCGMALQNCEAILHPRSVTLFPPQKPPAPTPIAADGTAQAPAATKPAVALPAARDISPAARDTSHVSVRAAEKLIVRAPSATLQHQIAAPTKHVMSASIEEVGTSTSPPPENLAPASVPPHTSASVRVAAAVTQAAAPSEQQPQTKADETTSPAARTEATSAASEQIDTAQQSEPSLPKPQVMQPVEEPALQQAADPQVAIGGSARALPPCSSDSEGSLPEIDTGGSASDSSSGSESC